MRSSKAYNTLLLSIVPVLYLCVCMAVFFEQRSLMYFPRGGSDLAAQTWKKVVVDDKILGVESLDQKPDTLIIFHGNVGNANMRDYYFNFIPKNYHVVVLEYPGFGLNQTQEISKDNIFQSARQLVEYAQTHTNGRVAIIGESLGTGIASEMAHEFNIEKLVLITPYSSIADVAQKRFWYLPVSLLIKDNFDSIQSLSHYKGKTLVMISENDKVIPPEFAEKLYLAISGQKEKIVVLGASHSGWIRKITDTQVSELKAFLK